MKSIDIPEEAIKDHDFHIITPECYGKCFECFKCKIRVCVPGSSYWKQSFFEEGIAAKIKKQGFMYYLEGVWKWDTIFEIFNLSCEEMRIRDILL